MHIVLLILKIIGAILGGLLGLVLLLLLLILFVPVRYDVSVKTVENVDVESCFSWLCHVIHANIRYEGKNVNYRLRIFGIPVKQNKKEAGGQKTEARKKQKKEKKTVKKEKPDKKKKLDKSKKTEAVNRTEPRVTQQAQTIKPKKSTVVLEQSSVGERKREISSKTEKKEKSPEVKKKGNGFHPIRKLKELIKRIQEVFDKLRFKIVKIKSTIRGLLVKKNKIIEFIKDEGTKSTWKKTKKVVFGWLKYIAPRKIKGYIRFGTGDPCQTGQILGAISLFYAKFHPGFSVYPDFETKTLKADLKARGRMSLIRFVRDGAGWYFDKEVKKCIADLKQLKEEL